MSSPTGLHLSIILLAVLVVSCHGYRPYPDPGPDIPPGKPFCASRQRVSGLQCCPGRQDQCTVPILDTICYCDEFCDRTVSDCCPDFWNLCRGFTWPPTTTTTTTTAPRKTPQQIVWTPTTRRTIVNNCQQNGLRYSPGDVIRINCNNCTCAPDSNVVYNWRCTEAPCLIRTDVINHVSTGQYGWRASNHTPFWGQTLDDGIQYRLGTFRPLRPVDMMTSLRVFADDVLPEMFDARVEWPGLIQGIDDQSNCASSWAFSTTSVAADRIRIASHGKLRESLSAQQLISCNHNHLQLGCQGGHLDRAWWYMRHFGVVSAACYPYTSGQTLRTGHCLLTTKLTSATQTVNCPPVQSQSATPTTSRLYQATPPYRIAPKEREIMKELMDNGPVQATMEVKSDFFMYRSGVYRYSSPPDVTSFDRQRTGYHSVRIIGWGVDHTVNPPIKYWLCANSWGRSWGEDGYFRIQRGNDESHIESFVVGVWGKVSGRILVPARRRGVSRLASDAQSSSSRGLRGLRAVNGVKRLPQEQTVMN